MRDRPILLAGIVGCEKAIVCTVANLLQALSDNFAESLFIANLVNELMRADEDSGLAKGGETKDLACTLVSGGYDFMIARRVIDLP